MRIGETSQSADAKKTLKEKFKVVSSPTELARFENEGFVSLRDELQKHLDADLAAFSAEAQAARARVVTAANSATETN